MAKKYGTDHTVQGGDFNVLELDDHNVVVKQVADIHRTSSGLVIDIRESDAGNVTTIIHTIISTIENEHELG